MAQHHMKITSRSTPPGGAPFDITLSIYDDVGRSGMTLKRRLEKRFSHSPTRQNRVATIRWGSWPKEAGLLLMLA
jgi:hypothetical protein